VIIATKVALSMGDAPTMAGLSRKHIIEGVNASLKRLGTDYIDLLYIHRLDPDTEMEEVIEALEHVVRQGKVLYLGASSTWTWQFVKMREMQKARSYSTFMAMQNFYNLAYREEEREMIPYCRKEGVGLVPWSPIARGFLAGNRPKTGRATNRAQSDKLAQGYFGTKQDYAILTRVEKIAGELGINPAQVAYAWVLSKPFITAPIIGSTKPYQLDDAIAALDIKLTRNQIKRLEAPYQPRAVMGHS
jgi:aryl-alcohol dehydrogenase-like predicted oxidoreductase